MTANLIQKNASAQEIKSLIRLIRPAEKHHDFPGDVDIDELFRDPTMPDHAQLWLTADGIGKAYAFVHFPYNNLTFESAAEAWTDVLEEDVFHWAIDQMRKRYVTGLSDQTLDSNCSSDDSCMTRFFSRYGFKKYGVESLNYELVLDSTPAPCTLPQGFTLRPLHPADELEAVVALHQAAHGTENFTLDDRRALMSTSAYLPDLDLVVLTEDGKLAGNCICGIETIDGIPIGYTDPLVVHPLYQGRATTQAGCLNPDPNNSV